MCVLSEPCLDKLLFPCSASAASLGGVNGGVGGGALAGRGSAGAGGLRVAGGGGGCASLAGGCMNSAVKSAVGVRGERLLVRGKAEARVPASTEACVAVRGGGESSSARGHLHRAVVKM